MEQRQRARYRIWKTLTMPGFSSLGIVNVSRDEFNASLERLNVWPQIYPRI